MFVRARVRVVLTYSVGVAIALTGLALFIMVALKAVYIADTPFSRLVVLLYQDVLPFQWVWNWLPNFRFGDSIGGIILTGPFLLGATLELIGLLVIRNAQFGLTMVNEAVRQTRIASLRGRNGPRQRQSIGDVCAGRDIHIQQFAEAKTKVDDWETNFWKGPLGGLLTSVAATLLAALITYLAGLTR